MQGKGRRQGLNGRIPISLAAAVLVVGIVLAYRFDWLTISFYLSTLRLLHERGAFQDAFAAISRTIDHVVIPLMSATIIYAFLRPRVQKNDPQDVRESEDFDSWGTGAIGSDAPARIDRLGTKDFAVRLADSIATPATRDGLVFGLEGSWGSGKSTVLSFIRRHWEAMPPSAATTPVVVHFNPWWFSGRDELRAQFFRAIREQVDERTKLQRLLDRLRSVLTATQQHISRVPFDPAEVAAAFAGMAASLLQDRDNPSKRHASLARALDRSSRRLIIVIEDLDRLPGHEVREMFSLVKAVADFPMTSYLLAYDRVEVARSLDNDGTSGDLYIRKIVQVPISMPVVVRSELQRWMMQEIDAIIQPIPDDLWDASLWTLHVRPALDSMMRVPRDVRRFANIVAVTFPGVRGDVHLTDFLGIAALKAFGGAVYEQVASVGPNVCDDSSLTPEQLREVAQELLRLAPAGLTQEIRTLLIALFPRLAEPYGQSPFWSGSTGKIRAERRICDSVSQPSYFGGSQRPGALSLNETYRLLFDAAKAEVQTAVRTLSSNPRRPRAVESLLRDMQAVLATGQRTRIVLARAEILIQALLSLGDELSSDDAGPSLEADAHLLAAAVGLEAIRALEQSSRGPLLASVFAEPDASLSLSVRLFEFLREESLLNEDDYILLSGVLHDRLESSAKAGTLLVSPYAPGLLMRWAEYSDDDRVRTFVESQSDSDEGFIGFARAMRSPASSNDRIWQRSSIELFDKFYPGGFEAATKRANELLRSATGPDRPGLESIVATAEDEKRWPRSRSSPPIQSTPRITFEDASTVPSPREPASPIWRVRIHNSGEPVRVAVYVEDLEGTGEPEDAYYLQWRLDDERYVVLGALPQVLDLAQISTDMNALVRADAASTAGVPHTALDFLSAQSPLPFRRQVRLDGSLMMHVAVVTPEGEVLTREGFVLTTDEDRPDISPRVEIASILPS